MKKRDLHPLLFYLPICFYQLKGQLAFFLLTPACLPFFDEGQKHCHVLVTHCDSRPRRRWHGRGCRVMVCERTLGMGGKVVCFNHILFHNNHDPLRRYAPLHSPTLIRCALIRCALSRIRESFSLL
jgi:hypothetical protein